MIYVQFDNERNIPEESVRAAARQARQWNARLRGLHGLSSRAVAAQASAAAGMIAGYASKVSRISGRFGETGIEVAPLKADYRAAMEERGGMRPRHLPWLACEGALRGEYDVYCCTVGFRLVFDLETPPATVTLNLHTRRDQTICPDPEDATLRVGVAEVPLPLYLPAGMHSGDLARALEVIMPAIEKSALGLWMESEGGTREVF